MALSGFPGLVCLSHDILWTALSQAYGNCLKECTTRHHQRKAGSPWGKVYAVDSSKKVRASKGEVRERDELLDCYLVAVN
jgi:hypothetical protein